MRALMCVGFLTLAAPLVADAAPSVEMFGASWCGPCRYVRSVLDQNGIAYRYYDVDTPSGRAAYQAARGSTRGIPLLVVGGRTIVGANLQALSDALGNERLTAQAKASQSQSGSYGGRSAGWWQAQFRGLIAYKKRLDGQIDRLAAVAADNIEKEQLEALKKRARMVEASINSLDNDASKVALPRKYRE